MGKKRLFALLFAMMLLGGCRKRSEPALTYVTTVQISGWHNYKPIEETYTEPEDMARVLNYLRLMRYPESHAQEPENLTGSDYTITLSFNDSTQKSYRVCADLYLSQNGGKWSQINGEAAEKYWKMVDSAENLLLPN